MKIGVGEVRISDISRDNVMDALADNRLTYGPWTKKFEAAWARLHRQRFAIFMNSGTSALHCALAALKEQHGWPDGAKVVVPATTFVATLNTVISNNLTPVFADVNDSDFLISTHGWHGDAVAVVPVALYGAPVPLAVYEQANERGMAVVTDACEAALYPNPTGGDITCFSTYACHIIQTGVGGFATTDSDVLATYLRSLMNHGRNGWYYSIDQELGDIEVINARFQFDRVGYSYRATEMEAAIGVGELDTWAQNLTNRAANATYLRTALADLPLQFSTVPTHGSSWMFFPIVAESRQVRDALVTFLESRGIETRMLLPLTNQPYVDERFGYIRGRYPVADKLNRRAFYVGCHQYLTGDELTYMKGAFHEFFART